MKRIGVVGAGAMGAGIAQVAALAGLEVLLYDVGAAPLETGLSRIQAGVERLMQRGRLSAEAGAAALERARGTTALAEFAAVDFAVEAAPESLDLKRQLFGQLDRICRPGVILATNTSSLAVTEIAAATGRPDLVVGMHFFNPVPLMKLVEVIRGARTSAEAAQATTELAVRLGKTPVQAKDTPGFIVNRIARPFPGEALRLVGENVAGVLQVDRVARLAAGFRMGPFELMDLVGMDVNFAVNRSVYEQFFQEPRFRPHPLQAQMVKANLLGRKTGAGWYRYEGDQIVGGPAGPTYATAPAPRLSDTVCVLGDEAAARLVQSTGYSLTTDAASADVVVVGDPGILAGLSVADRALVLVDASRLTTTEAATRLPHPGRVVGYGGIPSLATRQLVEIAPGLRTAGENTQKAAQFFHSLGRDTEVIHDGPGLIAPRLIACLANEAAFALMEGVAGAPDIDTAMALGVNYPRGPLAWANEVGLDRILAVLEHLQEHTGDDCYRPCPLLRKAVLAQRPLT